MDQTDKDEIARHLVGDPRRIRRQPPQALDIAAAKVAKLVVRQPRHIVGVTIETAVGVMDMIGKPAEIGQLAGAVNGGMRGENLFDQGRARTRHAEHEDRHIRMKAAGLARQQAAIEA